MNLATLDQRHVWHPFTQMRDWLKSNPTVIVSGKGPWLKDQHGKKYLDGNSSIWTNLHGHQHPHLNRGILRQLNKIAHSSALGLANEPASRLAEKLIQRAPTSLKKVFYSDDGSTALEAALKLAFQYWLHQKSKSRKSFLTLENAYHGDTVGAMSLGGVEVFQKAYKPLLFRTEKVMAPYCYRCPYNQAKPDRRAAHTHRKCHWECLGKVESSLRKKSGSLAAAVIEPLVQGAAGMVVHPDGYLKQFSRLCHQHEVPLILDEVMTGFGRTGTLFACEQENIKPDFLCLAKGMTGGYLPMAATLTSQKIFNGFLGDYAEMKTFFHGHSYSGNQLGAAAGLANLEIFQKEKTLSTIATRAKDLHQQLLPLWKLDPVGDIRQIGLVVGIELVRDWKTRTPYPWGERVGVRVCQEAKKRGVLTRPIGNVIVLMPPYCITSSQLENLVEVIRKSILEVCL